MKRISVILTALLLFAGCAKNTSQPAQQTTAPAAAVTEETTATEAETEETSSEKSEKKKDDKKPEDIYVTSDTEVFDGVNIGMTSDEIKEKLGDSEFEESDDDMDYMIYGGSACVFKKNKKAFGDDKKRLIMIVANKNDALVPAGDISFGCTKDKVIGAYYSDPEEDTPDDLKEAGGRIIYGRKDYEVFESISLGSNMDAEEDMSGRYMFAYESPGSGNSSVAYYVLDIDKKFKMSIYMLMYTFSDDEGLETITVMDMSGEDLQSLSDLASGEEDTADDANDTDNDDADDKE